MGCDIHMVVELFDWAHVDGGDEVQKWQMVIAEQAAFGARNYCLFGVLAGVRVPDMPQMAPERGLPVDFAPETETASKRLAGDGHTHSWVTIKEVLDFDWTQGTPYKDAPTCMDACADFVEWAKGLASGPTRIARHSHEHIRLVFWFDN